jgi:hypothetical protein
MPNSEKRELIKNIAITASMALAAGSTVLFRRGWINWDNCFLGDSSRLPKDLPREERNQQLDLISQECNRRHMPTMHFAGLLQGTGIYFAIKGLGPTRAQTRREFLQRLATTAGITAVALVADSQVENYPTSQK